MIARKVRRIIAFLRYDDYKISSIVNFLCSKKRSWVITKMLKCYLERSRYICIGKYAVIGEKIIFPHPRNVIIGRYAVLGNNCRIYHDVTIGQNKGNFPELGNNIIVYPGAKIVGDIKIEDNAIVGANSVVTKDVPRNAIVAGIPARIIGYRSDSDEFY